MQNTPDLWLKDFPFKSGDKHKYDYGHALVYAVPELTGATRLAAEAAARIGAGLVTVVSPPEMANIYRMALPAHIMVRDDPDWWDERVTAALYGPGGVSVKPVIRPDVVTVLDAGALDPLPLSLSLKGEGKTRQRQGEDEIQAMLTPHEGEFAKAFPDIKGSREERAIAAACQSGAVVVLKGQETVVAHPDGRFAVNEHMSPHLATAGTGDVLAGVITGLAAMGMEPFMAACAAVWIHGDCARRFGSGLVASDLIVEISAVLANLYIEN